MAELMLPEKLQKEPLEASSWKTVGPRIGRTMIVGHNMMVAQTSIAGCGLNCRKSRLSRDISNLK
jgi:hypothetical protein